MRSLSGRILQMGARADGFNDANPDTDQGNNRSAVRLKQVVAQMHVVAAAQRAGLVDKASASAEKARLRRAILAGPITHLAEVAKRARRTKAQLGMTFRYKPGTQSYVGFLTAVRSMLAAAEAEQPVLMDHGLSESVLVQFRELTDQFEAAVRLGDDGRTRHKGATKQLEDLATEVLSIVRTMDGRNRLRFQDDRQRLESWISASTVLGGKRAAGDLGETAASGETGPAGHAPGTPPVAGTPSPGGEVRPVA